MLLHVLWLLVEIFARQIIQNYIKYALKNVSEPTYFFQKVFFVVDSFIYVA